MKKVILAYSGGLDTSCCIKWLKDKGYEVVAFLADLGQGGDFQLLRNRASACGAKEVYVQDLKKEFITDFVFPALKANAVYESNYLLATALSRPLIAKYLVNIAHKQKAKALAHGCSGKGNDQVRFEVSINVLDPSLEVIAPLRVWELKGRQQEIEFAKRAKLPIDVTKEKPYSVDRNIWGASIECGVLEEPDVEPPENAYQITRDPRKAPDRPEYIDIYFKDGIPKKVNGKAYSPEELIERLNAIGSKHAIGRTDLIENRLVGIKTREIYEAPAAWMLYMAHRELEGLVLDRELLHFKQMVSLKYAELIYYGLAFSPLKEALDRFVEYTQRQVTGNVRLKLYKGSCTPVGRNSKFSLYNKKLATYGPESSFDEKEAGGFIKFWGMPYHK